MGFKGVFIARTCFHDDKQLQGMSNVDVRRMAGSRRSAKAFPPTKHVTPEELQGLRYPSNLNSFCVCVVYLFDMFVALRSCPLLLSCIVGALSSFLPDNGMPLGQKDTHREFNLMS